MSEHRGQGRGRLSTAARRAVSYGNRPPRFRVDLVLAGVVVIMAAILLTRATNSAEDERDAASADRSSLAAQVHAVCEAGGDAAAVMRAQGDACLKAEQVIASPIPGPQGAPGPGPTLEQISAAVSDYMIKHPAPAGRAPSTAEVSAAVAGYMLEHPAASGRPPTAQEIAAAVSSFQAAHPSPQGDQGPKGDQGAKGDDGSPGAQGPPGPPVKSWTYTDLLGSHTCSRDAGSPDSAATYTCE